MQSLYKAGLVSGLRHAEFWDMTPREFHIWICVQKEKLGIKDDDDRRAEYEEIKKRNTEAFGPVRDIADQE